jgi:hypothetical protein
MLSTKDYNTQKMLFQEKNDDGKLNLILSNPKNANAFIIDGKILFSDKIITQKS